ncbi:hypothetical protein [Micromonospora zhanjiangensis]
MPISLHRVRTPAGSRWAVRGEAGWARLDGTLADLLAMPLARARAVIEAAGEPVGEDPGDGPLPPVDRQEVWAAGVTYQRSREGRKEESGHGSVYDQVYASERPEIFSSPPRSGSSVPVTRWACGPTPPGTCPRRSWDWCSTRPVRCSATRWATT